MTWPNPPQLPNPPRTDRRCQYCGKTAEVFDVDGAWCTPEHQTFDRQSEITIWRKAVAV
ncbi:hypothetical protein [Micromonospora sp. CB01531]|uniref:hypothetical protein n=1 Tax=Micromonospora sp. CB01531 TaxID=1718947 RepID=UPI000ADB0858|nr:hypothetical protein [Micromonospora sp. CB01531]